MPYKIDGVFFEKVDPEDYYVQDPWWLSRALNSSDI